MEELLINDPFVTHLLYLSCGKIRPSSKTKQNVSRLVCMYMVDKCNHQPNPIPLACPVRKKVSWNIED